MEEKIVEYLKEKYTPKAFILVGSRAADEATEYSDWDIVLYVGTNIDSTSELFKGQFLDIEFIKLPVSDDHILQTSFAPDSRMKILIDTPDGIAQRIVEQTHGRIKQGPKKLTDEEYSKRKKKLYRLLQKCMARPDDEGYVFIYIGAVHEFALRYYFELRQEWSKPAYKALAHLREHDPDTYELFESIQGKTDSREKIKAGKKLYEKLFNEEM